MMKRIIAAVVAGFVSLPLMAMKGVVYSAAGSVANAKIEVFLPDDRGAVGESPITTASTGADGTFSVDVKVDGAVFARATAQGYAPVQEIAFADAADVVFDLKAAKEKSGVVRSSAGPVAGARVIVTDSMDDVLAAYLTDDHGHFSMPDPRTWASTVCVQHPSYAVQCRTAPAEGVAVTSMSLDFDLSPGNVVTGRVVTTAGAPATNARVSAGAFTNTTTAQDGTFKLRIGSDKELRAIANGMVGTVKAGSSPVTITIEPGHTITGSVRDEKGRAIPGTRVLAYGSEGDSSAAAVNAKGEYSLTALSAGQYRVWVQAPDDVEFAAKPADLRKKTSVRLDLAGTASQALRGIVRDENRQPVAGALVVSLQREAPIVVYSDSVDGLFQLTAISGADGKFKMHGTGRGQLAALKRGYAAGVSDSIDPQTTSKPVVITLPKGIAVTGVVVDPDGKPVADAQVAVVVGSSMLGSVPIASTISTGIMSGWVSTDDKGAFTVRLNPGVHDFGIWKKGFSGRDVGNVDVVDGLAPLHVVLDRSVQIAGRVAFKAHKPSGDLTVYAIDPSSRSYATAAVGADGTFVLDSLQPGTYMLRLSNARGNAMKSVTAPAKDVVLEAADTVDLHGRVTDKATGAPITKFEVSAGTTDDYFADNARDAEEAEHENGEFVQAVPRGPAQLTISAPGYIETKINVTASDKSEPIAVALAKGRKITGRVTSADGHPLEDVAVSVEDSYRTGAASDEGGEFTLDGARTEQLTVEFSKEGFVSVRKTIPAGNSDQHLDVTLGSGLRFTGRVVDKSGAPVEGARVSAESASADDAGYQSATTDKSGAFTIEGLAAARYSFRAAKARMGQAVKEDVDVTKPQTLLLTLGSEPTGTIHGTIAGASSGAWIMGYIYVTGEHERSASGQIGRDGKFVVEDAPAGEVSVRGVLLAADKQSSTKPVKVTVPEGGDVDVQLSASGGDLSVRGTVRSNGQPVPGANVSFWSGDGGAGWKAQTNADGVYEITGLEAGHFNVSVSGMEGGDYSTETDVVSASTFDINADFAQIAGRVVDDRGAAIEGAAVKVTSGAKSHGRDAETRTDANGTFALRVEGGTEHRISGVKSGYVVTYLDVPDGSTAPLTLQLHRGTGARVRLIDTRDGSTLSGFVVVRDETGKVQIPIDGDRQSDGSLLLPLPEGTYRVSASAHDYASNTIALTVPSADATIPLARGGTLVVRSDERATELIRLVMPNGDEYVRCYCNGIADIRLTGAMTKVDHVAPGTYRMDVVDNHGATRHSYPITINEGQQTTVDATK